MVVVVYQGPEEIDEWTLTGDHTSRMNEFEDVRSPKQHGSTLRSAGRSNWDFLDSVHHPKSPSLASSHHLSDEGFMSDATSGTTNGQHWHPPVLAPPASPSISRRPSFTASLPGLAVHRSQSRRSSRTDMVEMQPAEFSSASPEDGGNFRRSLQIDMKGLVGDAVGNVSVVGPYFVEL